MNAAGRSATKQNELFDMLIRMRRYAERLTG